MPLSLNSTSYAKLSNGLISVILSFELVVTYNDSNQYIVTTWWFDYCCGGKGLIWRLLQSWPTWALS